MTVSKRHRRSLLLVAGIVLPLASFAGCSGSNGGDNVQLQLASDADCYGIEIRVDDAAAASAGNDLATACTASPAVEALGCTASAQQAGSALVLSTTGCFVEDGTALFDCTVTSALASKIRDSATTRCGCGCRSSCPSAPTVAVCDVDGSNCENARGSAVAAAATVAPHDRQTVQITRTPSQETVAVSTTNYCGTCCDVYLEEDVHLGSGPAVREIEFDVIPYPECSFDGCTLDESLDEPSALTPGIDGGLHVCVSVPEGITTPRSLVNCTGTSGVGVGNVSALDVHLNPVNPPPTVIVDDSY